MVGHGAIETWSYRNTEIWKHRDMEAQRCKRKAKNKVPDLVAIHFTVKLTLPKADDKI